MAAESRRRACVLLVASVVTILACGEPSAPRGRDATPSLAFGKVAGGPSVTAATPSSGHQGDVTLDVTITGSGFDSGSKASWQLNGVAYPKITVNNTRFNNSTSVTANITIAPDAAVTNYDIAVTTSTGKKGIGAELFTVTYAIALSGMSEGVAISDGGVVAGYSGTISATDGGIVVTSSPGAPAVVVATKGIVNEIDRSGHTIGGSDANHKPVIWTSATGAAGSWAATLLPDFGNSGVVFGLVSDAAGDAVMMTGNANSLDGKRHPVVWTRSGGSWQIRVNSPIPGGTNDLFGRGINARGQVVGMNGSGCCIAAYWDSLGNGVLLSGLPGARNAAAYSISGDGTVAVGNSGTSAVLWRRTLTNGVYGAWSAAVAMENTPILCGKNGSSIAYDVNAAGTVAVGSSCGVAVAWRIEGGVVTARQLLQGLGPPNQSVARGISETAAPLAAGSAKASAGVYWWGF